MNTWGDAIPTARIYDAMCAVFATNHGVERIRLSGDLLPEELRGPDLFVYGYRTEFDPALPPNSVVVDAEGWWPSGT